MRLLIQRSKNSEVKVNNKTVGKISNGFVVFVGFTWGDDNLVIDKMINKLVSIRVFNDEAGLMNLSIKDVEGSILSISQFTLYADTKKGRRPSFVDALPADKALELYQYFNYQLKKNNIDVQTGIFKEDMEVHIINDGPVTIMLDSKIDL